jgi:hypothetical protein
MVEFFTGPFVTGWLKADVVIFVVALAIPLLEHAYRKARPWARTQKENLKKIFLG